MAEIDSSIYFRQQQADPFGAYERGMGLRQKLDAKKQQQDLDNAYSAAMVTGPDGKVSFNRDQMIGSLLKGGYGNQAGQLAMQWQKEDEAKKQQQIENQLRREQIYSDMNLKKQAFGLDTAKFDLERQKLLAEAAKKNTPASLNTTDKQRYDNLNMVINGLGGMKTALSKGDNTFSLIGDNDFTANRDRAVEAFGRMQSGGAINKDEEARFNRMLPTVFDNADMQQKKLLAIEKEMNNRFATLGLDPQQQGPQTIRMTDGRGGFFDVPENEYGEAIASGLNRAK